MADRQARVDLAAVYRLLASHGWGGVIFNHAAIRMPSNPGHFFINRHDLSYTEVTASNLVEMSMDDDLDERFGVNRFGFTPHSSVMRGRPDVRCPAQMCEHVAAQYEQHDKGQAPAEWPAYLRQLDQTDPGHRD